jgi:hypothetical protein
VLRRDRRRDVGRRSGDERSRLRGGDVLQHDLQCRKVAHDRAQQSLDEDALAIEDVDVRIGDFSVQRQHDTLLLHRRERGIDALERRDPRVRVRRRAGGVVLDRVNEARCLGARDFRSARVVGQVERHQRDETGTGGKGVPDALPIGAGGPPSSSPEDAGLA